ncbi:NAD(P)/FAD-dependent oxidoreductase [Dactylosporangium sp. NPDC049140]|uniref:phytoene desaturase family protein n=1 Tax=Dactylosporangium sp. NPDC049140 TaxID=3155647 RepID=UPI003404C1EC
MFRTDVQNTVFDVAVVGGGLAGLATALRLQAEGRSTVVLEAHGHAGGCAGYYRRRGFSFDVGATTLVDFERGGVGAELFDAAGLAAPPTEPLPGYVAWLPDRTVVLHRDQRAWHAERLRMLGDSPAHRAFWHRLDRLADAFWRASRAGVRMPMRGLADVVHNGLRVRARDLPLARHLGDTLGGALRRHGLRGDDPLVGLLSMLVEDTVHSTVDRAPLINAALGITIRGAGLSRATGGMRGFWQTVVGHYKLQGGRLYCGWRATAVEGRDGDFRVRGPRGTVRARQVVSALPVATTAALAGVPGVRPALEPFVRRDAGEQGGAVVVFLGVPEDEVAGPAFTHHQLLRSYGEPLGDGNNMFVSVSSPGDTASAPAGHRAVMLSTHTELAGWEDLDDAGHAERREKTADVMIEEARRVYPRLAERPVVRETGTPRAYARYTFRPRGAVGGVRQSPANANQHAVPHDIGVPGFWVVGDSTWPGLGTVACVLGSRIVAGLVLRHGRKTAGSAAGRAPRPEQAAGRVARRGRVA